MSVICQSGDKQFLHVQSALWLSDLYISFSWDNELFWKLQFSKHISQSDMTDMFKSLSIINKAQWLIWGILCISSVHQKITPFCICHYSITSTTTYIWDVQKAISYLSTMHVSLLAHNIEYVVPFLRYSINF